MLIKIIWYIESTRECIVADPVSAFDICYALDNYEHVRQWKLDVPLDYFIWYNETNNWKKLKHSYSEWDYS